MLMVSIGALLLASCATGRIGSSTTSSGVKSYTSDTCLVTGNKLGSMGSPVTKVYGNQEVKFCCKPCVAKFDKDPQRYLAKLP
jgi:YHS domain-containing protein